MSTVFYLETDVMDSDREIIRHTGSDLEVRIFHLDEDTFKMRFEQTTFFGEGEGCNLAFQLCGNNKDHYYPALYAIGWYANSIGKPNMKIIEKENRLAG